ncbi:unnamed protein product [Sphagnum balticum]
MLSPRLAAIANASRGTLRFPRFAKTVLYSPRRDFIDSKHGTSSIGTLAMASNCPSSERSAPLLASAMAARRGETMSEEIECG